MIAIDSNILIYAHRKDSPFHEAADRELTKLVEAGGTWAIPWPCLHEFLVIVTHPRIYDPPTPLEEALLQADCWSESPRLEMIGERADYWPVIRQLLQKGKITGPLIHDAKIIAICQQNGVKTLWSADRDFTRVAGIEIVNPLLR